MQIRLIILFLLFSMCPVIVQAQLTFNSKVNIYLIPSCTIYQYKQEPIDFYTHYDGTYWYKEFYLGTPEYRKAGNQASNFISQNSKFDFINAEAYWFAIFYYELDWQPPLIINETDTLSGGSYDNIIEDVTFLLKKLKNNPYAIITHTNGEIIYNLH